MDDAQLNELVRQAQSGDATALEAIVRAVQDDVFDLALRMLGDVTDARDASQEVLVRVVTKLGSFRGDSKFRTWVYRVAANALLNFRGEMRRKETSFDEAEEQLQCAIAASAGSPAVAADSALLNEVKLVCAHGMLLNLDRPHRIAYVLGEVLELSGEEGAAVGTGRDAQVVPNSITSRTSTKALLCCAPGQRAAHSIASFLDFTWMR